MSHKYDVTTILVWRYYHPQQVKQLLTVSLNALHVIRSRRHRWSLLHDLLGSSVIAPSAPSSAILNPRSSTCVIIFLLHRASPQRSRSTRLRRASPQHSQPPMSPHMQPPAQSQPRDRRRRTYSASADRSCPRSSLLTNAPTVAAVHHRQAQSSLFTVALMLLALAHRSLDRNQV
jgi:hypothetical protein